MKCLIANRAIATALTIILTTLLISPAYAVTPPKDNTTKKDTGPTKPGDDRKKALIEGIRSREKRKPFSADDIEQMRSALLAVVDANQLASTMYERSDQGETKATTKQRINDFDALRKGILEMSTETLTRYRKLMDPSAILEKAADAQKVLTHFKESLVQQRADSPNTGTLPGINFFCTGSPAIAPVSAAALLAADDVFYLAESVAYLAQDACNEVIAGESVGGACAISDGIYLAAKVVNQHIHFCDNDYNSSTVQANFERLGHIHTDLENSVANDNANKTTIVNNDNANKTSIVNNDNANTLLLDTHATTNTTNIVNNDNANRVTIVNNDNANALALTTLVNAALTQIISNANANKDETKNLLLRTQIEADLSSTDGSTFVALYETPVTVCFPSLNSLGLPQAGIPSSTVQCGLLDLVRSIVSQTIANVGAGTNAQSFFATGDAQRAAGKYKLAYSSYRQAYKAASK